MRESLNQKCRLFIDNRDAVKSAFPMESSYMHAVCSSIISGEDRISDIQALKETRRMLKSRVNAFSNFRGACELPVVAILDVDSDPEWRLDKAIELYKSLKEHFFTSEYLPMAAIILSGMTAQANVAERTKRIYDLMKKEHPFLTSSEDCVFAAMLAISPRSDEDLIRDVEICYNILKERFSDKNAVQSLSHVLTLADSEREGAADRCRDTIRLFDLLKEKKHKYGAGYELPTLGVLATLPCGVDETVSDLIAVSDFLKTQKGYGFFGFDRAQRMMHAAMIVASEHIGASKTMEGAAVSGTLSMIAAQHAATCAAISVSMAASAAASSAARG